MKKTFLLLFFLVSFFSCFGKNLVSQEYINHSKEFHYFFLKCKIPEEWKKSRKREFNFPDSTYFKVENKNLPVVSVFGEKFYFEYPTSIVVMPFFRAKKEDIEKWGKSVFLRLLLTSTQLKDYKIRWQNIQYKSDKLKDGRFIEYFGLIGVGSHIGLQDIVLSEYFLQVSGKDGSVLFFTGMSVDKGRGYSASKYLKIQNGYKKQVVNTIYAALTTKFRMPLRDRGMENFLIKKQHFRHYYGATSGINTGVYATTTSAGSKLYFDFFNDGTSRVLDTSFSSGYFDSAYSPSLGSATGDSKGRWSKRVKFSVYRESPNKYWLVLLTKPFARVYSLVKNAERIMYVAEKQGGKVKNVKKKIRGMEINGKIEGCLTQYGVIRVYSPPKN